MKKTLLITTLILLPFIVVALIIIITLPLNEDFAPYSSNEYKISQSISGNLFVISDVQEELDDIVSDYSDNVKLSFVKYKLLDSDSGEALFHYSYQYTKNRIIAKATFIENVDVIVDIHSKKVSKVLCNEGISKRVGKYSGTYIQNPGINSIDYYNNYISQINSYTASQISRCEVVLRDNDFCIDCFDSNNKIVISEKLKQSQISSQ